MLGFSQSWNVELCLTELHSPQDALPNRVHIFTAFLALFLMWLELHNGFALYYAKRYYEMNPTPLAADDTQHGFIFKGMSHHLVIFCISLIRSV